MKLTHLALASAAVGAALMASSRASAATAEAPAGDADPWADIDARRAAESAARASTEGNVAAFLSAIAWAEGTAQAADPYRVCYAYSHTIRDLSDHPAITKEWQGLGLTDQQCAGAGRGPGCVSTAAGRYQIVKGTWIEAKRALKLPDFGPASQDAAAVWLIQRRGALAAVQAGDITEATRLCRLEWASLPGANYAGQGMRRQDELIATYIDNGGTLA